MASAGADCTVSVVLPLTPLSDAEIVVLPAPAPVASPLALSEATDVFEEVHAT
jgi:hypothetical protein